MLSQPIGSFVRVPCDITVTNCNVLLDVIGLSSDITNQLRIHAWSSSPYCIATVGAQFRRDMTLTRSAGGPHQSNAATPSTVPSGLSLSRPTLAPSAPSPPETNNRGPIS